MPERSETPVEAFERRLEEIKKIEPEAPAPAAKLASQFTKRAVSDRDPRSLTIHSAVAGMPRLAADDSRYLAMQAAWAQSGALAPLFAVGDAVVDGRHRLWFALDQELETVPVIAVEEWEVPQVVMGSIIGRAHATKGQRAYLAVPYLGEAFTKARERHKSVLSTGGITAAVWEEDTTDDLADRLGISRDLLYQAKRLHEIFAEDAAAKAEYEPQILAAEEAMALGSAIAGIVGKKKPKPAPARNSTIQKFTASIRNLAGSCEGFAKLKAADVQAAQEAVSDAFAKVPAPALELIAAEATVALKLHAKAARGRR